MIISTDVFRSVCPAGAMPDDELIERISAFFDVAQTKVDAFIGDAVLGMLAESTTTGSMDERLQNVERMRERYVALEGYRLALPQLDLVMTPTGFGVVSNNNLTPASAERVNRLAKSLHELADEHLDVLIEMLRRIPQWSESNTSKTVINSLFWRASHVRRFGIANPTRNDLEIKSQSIQDGEMFLRNEISDVFYEHLIDATRTSTETDYEISLIGMLRAVVAAEEQNRAKLFVKVLSFVNAHISSFPVYATSSANKARCSETYENKEDDTCFFFG